MTLKNNVAVSRSGSLTLADVLPLVEQLSLEDRAALLERVAVNQPYLCRRVGGCQQPGNLLVHLNQMDPGQLSLVLDTIATRIFKEGW